MCIFSIFIFIIKKKYQQQQQSKSPHTQIDQKKQQHNKN